jgi:glycerol-3-phosphate dehydrogenase
MTHPFSAQSRPTLLHQLQQHPPDLLVIGGGITGAGIALDAQTRGMQTALLEMQDFGAGTSSRSTKLVHGGLRYLKQLEFRLVAEVGRERAIVYENGPHITQPEPLLLPFVQGGTLGPLGAAVGLRLYDLLAGVKRPERARMLGREKTAEREPLLRKEGLLGGATYYEYRTDDARLTLEVLKEAVQRGAQALNYVQVRGFLYERERVVGVKAQDLLTGQALELRARRVVNATGPWVDALDTLNDPAKGNKLHLTKGVHLVFDHRRLPLRQAAYFDAPDGRMIFAIPRDGKAYVGTTDTFYSGNIREPLMTAEDRDYLLAAAQYMFPAAGLRAEDVESNWVGLRPLIRQEGKGASEISRKDEIFSYPSGLLTIAGGKLTGYRRMAERIVDMVAKSLRKETGRSFGPSVTARIPLSGGQVGGSANFQKYVEEQTRQGQVRGLPEQEARELARFYGSNVGRIYDRLAAAGPGAEGLPPPLLARLRYSLEEEMTISPADFFVRRTGALYFNIGWVRRWREPVLGYMAEYFGWTPETTATYREELERLLEQASGEYLNNKGSRR